LARASGSSDDARQAQKKYESLANDFPQSNLSDDALMHAAEIALETFTDQRGAYNYYLKIIAELPPGDMLADAQLRLNRLATTSAVTSPAVIPASSVDDSSSSSPVSLTNIRVWSGADYTRVVLDVSGQVAYEPHQLGGKDPRVYVDLSHVILSATVPTENRIQNSLVSSIRTGRLDQEKIRIVLDLTSEADYKVFSLENPQRIVIDVRSASFTGKKQSSVPPLALDDSIANILGEVPTGDNAALHVPQQGGGQGIRLIVVDAGHGGKDPGALGRGKTREKDVTLQMAKRLAAALRTSLGCKVLLTREDDRYLSLRERTAYANQVGADLFISLHANASTNRNAYGLETYYLNLSKNNQAAEVAARENGTSMEDVSNLEAILFDLMANSKINESSRLAAEIQQALVQHLEPSYAPLKNLGVKQGPFHVLLGATMPSVLVEAAFISHHREEKRLNDARYQKHVADAIVLGIKKYQTTLQQVARH
jgi:N-acetylmuramoyl-L-alanine amidase